MRDFVVGGSRIMLLVVFEKQIRGGTVVVLVGRHKLGDKLMLFGRQNTDALDAFLVSLFNVLQHIREILHNFGQTS